MIVSPWDEPPAFRGPFIEPQEEKTGLVSISSIAALKGKKAAENAGVLVAERGLDALPPVVSVPSFEDDDAFSPEERGQVKVLEQALALANDTILQIHGQLGEANARIAMLMGERTQGVESIISALRDFQAGGARTGPVGSQADTLRGLFSSAGQLATRSAATGFFEDAENKMRLMLDTFKAASGGAFDYTMQAHERPDFYTSSYNSKADKNYPAKMILLDLKRSGEPSVRDGNSFVIVCIDKKIFYLPNNEFKSRADRVKAFQNDTGSSNPMIFFYDRNRLKYDYSNSSGNDGYVFNGGTAAIGEFIDEFAAKSLTNVLQAGEFNQSLKAIRAMGLVP